MIYRIAWWIDALVAALFAGYFALGLADGTVSTANIALWSGVLVALAAVLWGSHALRPTHPRAALALALLLAIPAALAGLGVLVLIFAHPRWN